MMCDVYLRFLVQNYLMSKPDGYHHQTYHKKFFANVQNQGFFFLQSPVCANPSRKMIIPKPVCLAINNEKRQPNAYEQE
jgi:hypothetical protein